MALRKFLFQNQTEGFSEEQAAADELSLGKATFVGVSGVAIDAGGFLISNLAAPSGANDAARKVYVDDGDAAVTSAFQAADAQIISDYQAADAVVLSSANSYTDSVASGFNVKDPVRVVATANVDISTGTLLTIDGETLVAGDRVLLTGQTAPEENGIYVAATGAWARAADYDGTPSNEVATGDSIYVLEGSSNENTTWVLVTSGTITIDTTGLTFRQFSSANDLVAGAGLTRSGNTFNVGAGDGIAVAADSVAVSLASNPGLQFNSGALEAKPDTARGLAKDSSGLYIDLVADSGLWFVGGDLAARIDTSKGLEFSGGAIAVKLDGATLSQSASGLKVDGLPALFEVDGVAVGATVTAANLDALTDGSNADALHTHTAAAATEAPKLQVELTTSAAVAAGVGVYFSGDDTVATASASSDAAARCIGVSVASALSGAPVQVVKAGVVEGILSGATANTPYYLGPSGTPVLFASLAGGARTVRLGFAKNATDLDVQIHDYGKKAS